MQQASTPHTSSSFCAGRLHHLQRALPGRRPNTVCHSRRDDKRPGTPSNLGVLPNVPITRLERSYGKDFAREGEAAAQHQHQQGEPGGGPSASGLTVYSVRFTTGNGRGAGLSETACVNVCLLARSGRAVMHRISPVFDPQEDSLEMAETCQLLESGELGAECLHSAASKGGQASSSSSSAALHGRGSPASKPRIRFQEGNVDEVCFVAPELGPKLAGIIVGTESGTWGLEEVHLMSSRTGAVQRFVCRSQLGAHRGEGACFLSPVPAGSVVYGSGSAAVALSQEEAAAKRAANLVGYESLKQRLLRANALLVLAGSGIAAVAGTPQAGISFAAGGGAGVLYQWLLQQGVDSMSMSASGGSASLALAVKEQGAGKEGASSEPTTGVMESGGAGVRSALGRPFVRLLLLTAFAVGGASLLQGQDTQGLDLPATGISSPLNKEGLAQLAVGILGFLTYKVALISVSASDATQKQAAQGEGGR